MATLHSAKEFSCSARNPHGWATSWRSASLDIGSAPHYRATCCANYSRRPSPVTAKRLPAATKFVARFLSFGREIHIASARDARGIMMGYWNASSVCSNSNRRSRSATTATGPSTTGCQTSRASISLLVMRPHSSRYWSANYTCGSGSRIIFVASDGYIKKYCRATANCEINNSIGLIPDPAPQVSSRSSKAPPELPGGV